MYEEPLILTEAPLRFVLKVFSVLRRGRARSKLLGPNRSSEYHHYDGAFGETYILIVILSKEVFSIRDS